MSIPESTFAVTIDDGGHIYWWIRIRRSKKGEIFCMLANAGQGAPNHEDWDPHWSWHADGTVHYKSFGPKRQIRQSQKPDHNFKGTEWFFTTDIRSDELTRVPCKAEEFADCMNVPIGAISPDNPRDTHISLYLTEPGGRANLADGCNIIQQREFNKAWPAILAVVWS